MADNQEQFIDGEEIQEKDFKFTVGIIGNNESVKSLRWGFSKPRNDVIIADGIEFTIDDVVSSQPHLVFCCTDTTVDEEGNVIASDLENDVLRILANTEAGVVVKTPLPIDLVDRLCAQNRRIVYHPDIITETETMEEKTNLSLYVLGGHPEATLALQEIYYRFTKFGIASIGHVSAVEAAMIEHSISSIVAMKAIYFNQLYDVVQEYGGDYQTIATYVGSDGRVGSSAIRIPTLNMNRGYDKPRMIQSVKQLAQFNERFTLLKEVDRMNETYLNRKETE